MSKTVLFLTLNLTCSKSGFKRFKITNLNPWLPTVNENLIDVPLIVESILVILSADVNNSGFSKSLCLLPKIHCWSILLFAVLTSIILLSNKLVADNVTILVFNTLDSSFFTFPYEIVASKGKLWIKRKY